MIPVGDPLQLARTPMMNRPAGMNGAGADRSLRPHDRGTGVTIVASVFVKFQTSWDFAR